LTNNLFGILSALASSTIWGGVDFAGGIAAQRRHNFQVIALAGMSGFLAFALLGFVFGESLPDRANATWALLAGLGGGLASAILFKGLAQGSAATVSPTSAVVGATLPVIVGYFLEGSPGFLRLTGIGLGLAGIWLVNQADGDNSTHRLRDLSMGLTSGFFVGIFFLCFGQIEAGSALFGGSLSKLSSAILATLILTSQRQRPLLGRPDWLTAGIGIFDACANLCYLTARQLTRLDVAAVISSMYPAGTVLLAWLVQRQPVSRRQWLGIIICLSAVGLISI
jgi:drug/metabolite transporter (DMT)-like permease